MSFGFQAAFALHMMISGAAGFEYQMMLGNMPKAWFEVALQIGGIAWLWLAIDGKFER